MFSITWDQNVLIFGNCYETTSKAKTNGLWIDCVGELRMNVRLMFRVFLDVCDNYLFCCYMYMQYMRHIYWCIQEIHVLYISVLGNCRMFVGSIAENPHETITRPLGGPRGLKAYCIC